VKNIWYLSNLFYALLALYLELCKIVYSNQSCKAKKITFKFDNEMWEIICLIPYWNELKQICQFWYWEFQFDWDFFFKDWEKLAYLPLRMCLPQVMWPGKTLRIGMASTTFISSPELKAQGELQVSKGDTLASVVRRHAWTIVFSSEITKLCL
jgi:hypothetical protein